MTEAVTRRLVDASFESSYGTSEHGENAVKERFAEQNVRLLRASVCVAPKMGSRLGAG
jgi:hypothetical protein